jgi:NAD(P)-dependent dehydrogenase (short-subunit alcohol dehydrogenase family)
MMKSVVITGGTRGLGLCLAKEFLKLGCGVTVCGSSGASLDAAEKELAAFNDRTLFLPCDVRDRAQVEALWAQSAEKWGRVDVWVNNAGRNVPYETAWDTEPKYVDAVVDTNLKGMIFGSQVAAKGMRAQGGGQIWNMEGLGSNDMIQAKTILYGTTKRALTYFTRGLAKELEGSGVLAGRLSPGMMPTDFLMKGPEGERHGASGRQDFLRILNILGDRPETVAAFFVPRILANKKNDAHLVWLTGGKAMARFMVAPFKKRKLVE